jgi:hypothetical protein
MNVIGMREETPLLSSRTQQLCPGGSLIYVYIVKSRHEL